MTTVSRSPFSRRWFWVLTGLLFFSAQVCMAQIGPFVGEFEGSADIKGADGSTEHRDMSVMISETKKGFRVKWVSVSYKEKGRKKAKSYTIEFLPTPREGVFASAMARNVFGHAVPLDPMKGEPFVWARIADDTLTVFSLFVGEGGDYELQQFDRTLAEGGLDLEFRSFQDGALQKTVSTFLKRQ